EGNTPGSVPTVDLNRRFTGQILDPETGLYYYGGRYYDADVGRFVSPDPFIQAPYDSQNLNRFTYVLNNPQNYIDPSGYFHRGKKSSFWKSFGGIIVGAIISIATAGYGASAVLAGAIGGFVAGAI